MKIKILGDFDSGSHLESILWDLNDLNFKQYFKLKDYGNSITAISIFFICQDPSLNLKQRIKYFKKDRLIFIDIMFNLKQLKKANDDDRRRLVADTIINDVPSILKRYNLGDFNIESFKKDLNNWFLNNKWTY